MSDDDPASGGDGAQAADQARADSRQAGDASRGDANKGDAGKRGAEPSDGKEGADKREADKGSSSEGLTLRDATHGFDDQRPEIFDRGGQIYRPGIEAVVRGGKHVHIGNSYTYLSTRAVAPSPGPVRPEALEAAGRHYVEVSGFPSMMAALRSRRLLLLGGAPETGRSTTGLRMLAEICRGAVSRLDHSVDPCTFTVDDLETGHGYLGELIGPGPGPTGPQADHLADLLDGCDCHLVLVVPPEAARGDAFAVYGIHCPAPDITELIGKHLHAQLAADPDDLEDTLVACAASAHITEALGPAPRVREAVELSGLLIAHGRREIALEEVEEACQGFVERQVDDWFTTLRLAGEARAADHERRRTAFRLAVAVLHDMPRGAVLQVAEDLGDLLIKVTQPLRTPGRDLTTEPDDVLFATARVRSGTGHMRYAGAGSIAVENLGYRDDRYPQAVLSHVWRRHHNLRPPMVAWLSNLAVDDREYLRICAAQASGMLSWDDFPWTFDQLILPAAACEVEGDADAGEDVEIWRRRRFAALALDQAALDERLRPIVIDLLREWRRRGSPAQRCTAALTFGFALGSGRLDVALTELRILGTPQEFDVGTEHDENVYDKHGDVIWASGLSLMRLFATGAQHAVFDRLIWWTGPGQRRSVRLLVLQTVYLLADKRLRFLSENQFAAGRGEPVLPARFAERRKWPLVLAFIDDDPTLGASAVQLFRYALSSQVRQALVDKLGRWMEVAQDDPALLAALCTFLGALADESTRELIAHEVVRRGRAWADAVRPDVVAQLLGALTPHADMALAGRTDLT